MDPVGEHHGWQERDVAATSIPVASATPVPNVSTYTATPVVPVQLVHVVIPDEEATQSEDVRGEEAPRATSTTLRRPGLRSNANKKSTSTPAEQEERLAATAAVTSATVAKHGLRRSSNNGPTSRMIESQTVPASTDNDRDVATNVMSVPETETGNVWTPSLIQYKIEGVNEIESISEAPKPVPRAQPAHQMEPQHTRNEVEDEVANDVEDPFSGSNKDSGRGKLKEDEDVIVCQLSRRNCWAVVTTMLVLVAIGATAAITLTATGSGGGGNGTLNQQQQQSSLTGGTSMEPSLGATPAPDLQVETISTEPPMHSNLGNDSPSKSPTNHPATLSTSNPSELPTTGPSEASEGNPTIKPATTNVTTTDPTRSSATETPTTSHLSTRPYESPSATALVPSTDLPSSPPSFVPSPKPTNGPTQEPTALPPSTNQPSATPSTRPPPALTTPSPTTFSPRPTPQPTPTVWLFGVSYPVATTTRIDRSIANPVLIGTIPTTVGMLTELTKLAFSQQPTLGPDPQRAWVADEPPILVFAQESAHREHSLGTGPVDGVEEFVAVRE